MAAALSGEILRVLQQILNLPDGVRKLTLTLGSYHSPALVELEYFVNRRELPETITKRFTLVEEQTLTEGSIPPDIEGVANVTTLEDESQRFVHVAADQDPREAGEEFPKWVLECAKKHADEFAIPERKLRWN